MIVNVIVIYTTIKLIIKACFMILKHNFVNQKHQWNKI